MKTSRTVLLITMLLALAGSQAWASANEEILDPSKLTEQAPDKFQVKFETSKGEFVVEVTRAWAPLGADRFFNLAKSGYYDNQRFFRVVPNFVVQWGLHGLPSVNEIWRETTFADDPVKESNRKGYITFATRGPNTRTTQLFISLKDNVPLDAQGFAPFGKVISGMDVVASMYSGYNGRNTPAQGKIVSEGNKYLKAGFPELDFIGSTTILGAGSEAEAKPRAKAKNKTAKSSK